jgi:flavin reductase (DIM6/NTAB) family NADH-FMN oxidoreductase RutF
MTVEAMSFRQFFGSVPAAVSIITTVGGDGAPRGFTCTALSAVSLDPPLLLICVDEKSSTLPALESTGAFVVNMVGSGGQDVARAFAGPPADRFTGVSWRPSTVAAQSPILDMIAHAYAECVVVRSICAGDHRILLGRVCSVDVLPRHPVVYQRGRYDVFGTDVDGAWSGGGEDRPHE